jgi:hypothetical protein
MVKPSQINNTHYDLLFFRSPFFLHVKMCDYFTNGQPHKKRLIRMIPDFR